LAAGTIFCPVLPGKREAGKAFIQEAFVTRRGEFEESRRAWSQNVEVVTISPTPVGDMLCVCLEGTDPVKGNRDFAASTRPFDLWFRGRLKELFPPQVDFDKPVPGVAQIFDSVSVLVRA
jgi:hypothetical protein